MPASRCTQRSPPNGPHAWSWGLMSVPDPSARLLPPALLPWWWAGWWVLAWSCGLLVVFELALLLVGPVCRRRLVCHQPSCRARGAAGAVEDMQHFVLECPFYASVRQSWGEATPRAGGQQAVCNPPCWGSVICRCLGCCSSASSLFKAGMRE